MYRNNVPPRPDDCLAILELLNEIAFSKPQQHNVSHAHVVAITTLLKQQRIGQGFTASTAASAPIRTGPISSNAATNPEIILPAELSFNAATTDALQSRLFLILEICS